MGADASETLAQRAERLAAKIEPTPSYGYCRHCDEYRAPDEHEEAAATLRDLAAANAQLERERDEAQSVCTAWQGVFETIEAHLQDRVAMRDEADPQQYLNIILFSVADVLRSSKHIVAARWADYARLSAERDAATSALAKAEGERDALPRYRHIKRGTVYEIVLRCCLQLDGDHDMSPMVVYRDVADGSIWTRRQSEFFDGRFAALTPAPEAPKDGE